MEIEKLVTPEEVERMYHFERMSDQKVAARLQEHHPGVAGLSATSVKRFRHKYGIRKTESLPQASLDEVVHAAYERIGKACGWNKVKANIAHHDHIGLSRDDILKSSKRLDPIGFDRRTAGLKRKIERRPIPHMYGGESWSVDQNEKLRKYGVVLFMGVDSGTRKIMFWRVCASRNSLSLLRAFREAVIQYGFPDTTRMDAGSENLLLRFYINLHKELRNNKQRDAWQVVQSTHNIRVEKMWGEVNVCVHKHINDVLVAGEGIDFPDVEVDLVFKYCLSYVLRWIYPTMMRENLDAAWNGHYVRSVGVPDKLWNDDNRGARISEDLLWTAEEAAEEYIQQGGQVTIDETAGYDLLAEYPNVKEYCLNVFHQRYDDPVEIVSACYRSSANVNNDLLVAVQYLYDLTHHFFDQYQ
ncbi:hypothetical protein HDU79_006770 [Rhizoclosmatium sp. JEL0117]|nr:hypothetical protein HDU79_006770 [Rhizoclosmatium sp. JEL0117]